MGFRSGYVAVVGKPNVGKSTLLNALLGIKISIVSSKPSTTRKRILGIKHLPDAQILFVDTPGLHRPRTVINERLVGAAIAGARDADLLLVLVEAHRPVTDQDLFVLEALRRCAQPRVLALTKHDLCAGPAVPHPEDFGAWDAVVPLSALTGQGLDTLLATLAQRLPEGPAYYPEDMLTDELERDLVAEIIREKVFHLTGQEIPYAVAVVIDSFVSREGKNITDIEATILVERASQKGMVIGKGGQLLKRIGTVARAEIESLLDTRVFLRLWVKVDKNWRTDADALARYGYR